MVTLSLLYSSGYLDYSSNFVPEGSFRMREEAIIWLQRVALNLLFALVTKKFDDGGGSRRGMVSLGCERGGIYRGLA
ncbi:hypothetical protein Syun_023904 [Stephania yunnanensis]|uniref:Uncharacterized protein n=1 Tax=Stephania yunnanensis TaxID=152371 RepID=A0AAP0I015_9MAGN